MCVCARVNIQSNREHLIIYTTSVRILAASAIAATSAPGGRP